MVAPRAICWRPSSSTVVSLNQYHARPVASPAFIAQTIPRHSTGLLVSQAWAHGWTTALTYSSLAPMLWLGESTPAGRQRFAALHVARSFRVNDSKVNLAARWREPLGRSDEFRELQRVQQQFWISVSVEY